MNNLTGKPVIVKLKWGMEYKGIEFFQFFNCYIYYFLYTVLPVTIFISLYITFSGYLVSVDSYINLQVLIDSLAV